MASEARQADVRASNTHEHQQVRAAEDSSTNLSISESLPSSLDSDSIQRPPGISIRDIRLSMNHARPQPQIKEPSPPQSIMPRSLMSPSQAPFKKKSSFWGGIFAMKEPTQPALEQMKAQLTAQHGSATAHKVPNVRMEKMPQHVPKVNSKWDGVPDAVKQKEKLEKELAKAAKRHSITAPTARSGSSDAISRPSGSRQSDHSDLSLVSRDPRSRNPNPHRFYAQSVNSSGDLAAQLREDSDVRSTSDSPRPSTQTSSSRSVGDPVKPTGSKSHSRKASRNHTHRQENKNSGNHAQHKPRTVEQNKQPVKPQPAHRIATGEDVVLVSSGHGVLPLPSPKNPKQPIQSNPAFLAGEAQEFQMPDDNSESDAPEAQSPQVHPSAGPRRATDDDRPASANDAQNAQLRPKATVTGRLSSLLKREA